jgi:LPS-assembly lipoprotein
LLSVRNLPRLALLGLTLLGLAGCGFRPLYGADSADGGSITGVLNTVAVAPIPDRQGQLLREALETKLDVAGAPIAQRYVLTVSYGVGQQAAGIQADSSISYIRFVANAAWSLAPAGQPGHPIASGNANSIDSANVIDSQYFALTLETNTINKQLAAELSRQIVDQLALYFRAHPQQSG